ncbi:sugar (and other) transporter family protein [Rhodococcus sp. MTM3W5.2]|uniref:MFS transporter n=1 Tax=Rhodococcus sp. MTM3W5.2 TaxID=1805827 RepID=UPI000979510D|nr:MFS transporter [Rhodococcus sp. MTM3W5.2]AQA26157.1 sugar (and other) transporter family protein [Rhodococcus sp. MTM3W5.2]
MVAPAQPGGSVPPQVQDALPQRWTPRLIFSLASIVLVLEMLAISYMMISMAIPAIAGHYQTTQGAWLLTSFLLVGAMTAPLIGKLADMYGKRKLLLACIAIAALGSFVSAVAGSYAVLIAGRALSGLLVPCLFLSYSLIRDVFPAKTIALAVSIATSGMGLIAIPAPFITGWLIDNHGFRSIFWFFVIGLVILGGMIFVSTDESTVRLRSRLDFLGALLLGGGIAGILIAISFGPTWGWKAGSTLAYLFGGIALVVAWLVTAATMKEPLIDLKVLRRRPVILTATAAGFIYGVSGLYTMLLPMMVMTPAIMGLGYGFGVDAEGFAIFQAPIGAMTVVGGLIVGVLVGRHVKPRPLLAIGMVSAAIGCSLTAFSHDSKGTLIVFAGLVGLGMGMGYASIPNLLIEAVPPQLQASTASIVGVFQSVFPAALPVIAFTVMNNSHIAPIPLEMTQGMAFYTDKGFQIAFLIAAAAAVAGLVAGLLLPRRIEQVAVPTSAAAGEPAMATVD